MSVRNVKREKIKLVDTKTTKTKIMTYSNEIELEHVIEADPTLKFFLRDAKMDYDKLEHQANVMSSCIVIAINKWLDLKYR